MKKLTIRCPKCDMEYLPSEIFIPKQFFGTPEYIYRDNDRNIIDIIGTTMDTTETYTCDHCNTTFTINCKLSFNTHFEDSLDFNTDYERNF